MDEIGLIMQRFDPIDRYPGQVGPGVFRAGDTDEDVLTVAAVNVETCGDSVPSDKRSAVADVIAEVDMDVLADESNGFGPHAEGTG